METNLRRIYFGFAGAYLLSYLFRTVNAVISPELTRELGLSPSALGLLTAAYALMFMTMQLPLGILIDRYGPRVVETSLLLVAATGALAFSLADSAAGLTIARGLIGAGVSGCLMCALNGFQRWYPPERRPAMTGWIMAAAGVGAVFATSPVEWGLRLVGWRGVFHALAGLTLLAAIMVWLWVPSSPRSPATESLAAQIAGIRRIYSGARFWRIAPLMSFNQGSFMAIQGLWSVPWLMSVEGLSRAEAAGVLFVTALVMLAGFLGLGLGTQGLARRGLSHGALFTAGMGGSLAMLALIVLRAPLPPALTWSLYGGFLTVSTFSFNLLAHGYPLALAGRATTAMNLLIFAGHLVVQWGVGVAVEALMGAPMSEARALRVTFLVLLLGHVATYLWFLAGRRRFAEEAAPAPAR